MVSLNTSLEKERNAFRNMSGKYWEQPSNKKAFTDDLNAQLFGLSSQEPNVEKLVFVGSLKKRIDLAEVCRLYP